MSRSAVRPIFWVLAAAAIVAMVVNNGQWVEKEVTKRPSPAAQKDPFLAASRLLARLGLEVHADYDLQRGQLPAEGATLVIPVARHYLPKERTSQLLSWVARGSHLVTVPSHREGRSEDIAVDPILHALGVDVISDAEPTTEHGDSLTTEMAWVDPDDIGTGPSEPLNIGPRRGLSLGGAAEAMWQVSSDEATHVVSVAHGQGMVTVLADSLFMTTRYLGVGDNAWLLFSIASDFASDGGVYIVSRLRPPTLMSVLRQRVPLLCVSLAVLLCAWIWRRAARFGPVLEAPPPVRRSLMEHIGASGLFVWRHAGSTPLLRACQEAVRTRAARRAPGFARLDLAEKNRRIAQLAGADVEKVAAALSAMRARNEAEMTTLIRLLEELRLAL